MMGLLGNVAEVKRLRSRLMTTEFITVFSNLLDSSSDGIEVSYNAAGVLAHIASDGVEAWTIESPTRHEVLTRMVLAIERWSLSTERNINYRSFEPILGLVRCYETPECQHWAIWALANLTKVRRFIFIFFLNSALSTIFSINYFLQVYPLKYCKLVEDEHGVDLLNELVIHPVPNVRIQYLAKMVLENCYMIKCNSMSLDG